MQCIHLYDYCAVINIKVDFNCIKQYVKTAGLELLVSLFPTLNNHKILHFISKTLNCHTVLDLF